MKQVFPKEIMEHTLEVHLFKHSRKSRIIYFTLLLLVLGAFIALPLIKIDVYSAARGIIKSTSERVSIHPIQSGKVVYVHLKNNLNVNRGDTLLIIENPIFREQISLLNKKIEEKTNFIKDLRKILTYSIAPLDLKTQKFHQVYANFKQGLQEHQIKFKKQRMDYIRDSLLHKKEVISRMEFENKKHEYQLSKNAIKQWEKQHKSRWQNSITELKINRIELESEKEQLQKKESQFVVTAPLNGTLLGVAGINNNSFVTAGQTLASISPQGEIIVEAYVNPANIGYLKPEIATKFQIDAFNYNQWGMASGEVTDIGRDIEWVENNPVFKVKCKIDNTKLFLKNGVSGDLTKGMTLSIQFKLTERSLFELLYDKIDDWLNPNKNSLKFYSFI